MTSRACLYADVCSAGRLLSTPSFAQIWVIQTCIQTTQRCLQLQGTCCVMVLLCTCKTPSSMRFSKRTWKASPTPSQTGRWKRVWVQAKIQGMARRVSMLPAALRLAGRLPMFMRPSSLTGVLWLKKSMKRGSFLTTSRYASHDT